MNDKQNNNFINQLNEIVSCFLLPDSTLYSVATTFGIETRKLKKMLQKFIVYNYVNDEQAELIVNKVIQVTMWNNRCKIEKEYEAALEARKERKKLIDSILIAQIIDDKKLELEQRKKLKKIENKYIFDSILSKR